MRRQYSVATMKITNCLKGLVRNKSSYKRDFVNIVRWNSSVKLESAKPFEDIPSVMMLPIIGTTWQHFPIIGRYNQDRRHLAFRDKQKRMGNIIRERFGAHDIVLCFTLKDLETILRSEGIYPYAMELSTVKAYRESRKHLFSTKGLLCLQGKEWHELRSKTQKHLLNPLALQVYLEPLQMVAREFVQRISKARDANMEVPDLYNEMCKWCLECVSFVGLDTRFGCLRNDLYPDSDAAKLVESAMTIFECKSKLEEFTGIAQYWKYMRTPTWKKFEEASDVFSGIFFKYINESLRDLIFETKNQKKKLTLLQAMLANKDLNVSDAVVFVADLMMAGIETTSNATGFLLYHLARNPEKQDILYKEIMRLLPNQDAKLDPEIFEDSKYLKACWKESMRLTPIAPAYGRVLTQDTVLSGYLVRAGTFAAVLYEPIYMDETIFKNATQFLPERWMDRNAKLPKFAFIPFGFGPRSCIGRRLAEIKTVALVSEILRKFKIEYHYEDIGICTKVINVPDKPLRFKFIER